MNHNFRVSVETRTATSYRTSSFGKISIDEESILFDTTLGSMNIPKEKIIELRFYRKRFPRLTAIGQNGDNYQHGSVSMFRQRKGRDIYNTLESFGYTFTVTQERITWLDVGKELNQDMEKYRLYMGNNS